MLKRIFVLKMVIALIVQAVWAVPSAMADDAPVFVSADDVAYNQEEQVVEASGNVEIIQKDKVLLADKLRYFQEQDRVEAEGNVSFMEPTGNVVFANKVVLRQNLKTGVVSSFRARMHDNALFAANSAEKVDQNITILDKAAYSPCPLCVNNPGQDPQWQFKAKKVTLDEESQTVSYNHAFFEVYGVPIMYTPYLSHAMPGADRKTGFLIPSYEKNNRLGTAVKVPYYYNIAPNKDVVISPIFTSNEGTVLQTDYRHLLPSGSYKLRFTATNPKERDDNNNRLDNRDFRGHIEGEGKFSFADYWQWGFEGKRSTDDTYLRKYGFGNEDSLTSKLYARRIHERDFFEVESLTFQGLNADDAPNETPLIMPVVNSHIEHNPGLWNSRLTLDSNLLLLTRDEGVKSRRASMTGGWEVPYISDGGHVFNFRTAVRGDIYSVEEVPENEDSQNSEVIDSFKGRAIPEAQVLWKYPLMRPLQGGSLLLEPTVRAIASPYGGNPKELPNEDSQDLEFSDENLFDANHFTGYDRVESGPRVNYGVRARYAFGADSELNALVGQNYRAKKDDIFSSRSGLDSNLSDYVGRLGVRISDNFDAAYKFRFDKENFLSRKNEIQTNVNWSPFTLNARYFRFSDDTEFEGRSDVSREFIQSTAEVLLTDEWSISADGHRDLEKGQWVSSATHFKYHGACADFIFTWSRDFTQDRDASSTSSFSFMLSLKNFN